MSGIFKLISLSALLAVAQARPYQRQASAQVYTSCTVPNTAAITFDDGPYTWTEDIVNTLDAAGAKGTFFVNGNNFNCIYSGNNPSHLQYAYARGHQIASHTWSHPHLPTLSANEIRAEMTSITAAIYDIIGVAPAFMRPPYGEYSQDVQDVAGSLGQTVVTWDLDSGDAAGASVAQSEATYDDRINQRPNSILTLNHETHSTTANELLPYIISRLQGAGYNLVTVAECLGMDAYLSQAPGGSPGSC